MERNVFHKSHFIIRTVCFLMFKVCLLCDFFYEYQSAFIFPQVNTQEYKNL